MIEGPGILKSASCGEFSELLSSYPDSCVRPMQRVRSWPAYTLELITKCKETGGAPGLVWTGAENLSHTPGSNPGPPSPQQLVISTVLSRPSVITPVRSITVYPHSSQSFYTNVRDFMTNYRMRLQGARYVTRVGKKYINGFVVKPLSGTQKTWSYKRK